MVGLSVHCLKPNTQCCNSLNNGVKRGATRRYTVEQLQALRHFNGQVVSVVYGAHDSPGVTGDTATDAQQQVPGALGQGPVIAFNLLRPDGSFVGYRCVKTLPVSCVGSVCSYCGLRVRKNLCVVRRRHAHRNPSGLCVPLDYLARGEVETGEPSGDLA